VSPTGPDTKVALAMLSLFDRGRIALVAYVNALPPFARPMGESKAVERMNVVTAEDFDTHASLIRRHVCANACMVHVLCEDGHLCAIVEPRPILHW
jgi:hypothetical protein